MAQVHLILQEAVPNLGEVGDLVKVKPGFARNFLIPQGKAIFATEARVRELEHHKRVVAEKAAKQLKDLQAFKQRVEAVAIRIAARVGEEGKLFGSVTSLQVHEALVAQGFEVERRRIELPEPIKEAGDHAVRVRLHREVVAEIKISVVAEE